MVEGRTFTVRAASVRYTSDKEVLTIEGNGRRTPRSGINRSPASRGPIPPPASCGTGFATASSTARTSTSSTCSSSVRG